MTQNKFNEFKFKGKSFNYTGKVYEEKDGRAFVYLTIDGLITIQCHIVDGKNGDFLSFPSYKTKDNTWKSFIYTDEELKEELEGLCKAIRKSM